MALQSNELNKIIYHTKNLQLDSANISLAGGKTGHVSFLNQLYMVNSEEEISRLILSEWHSIFNQLEHEKISLSLMSGLAGIVGTCYDSWKSSPEVYASILNKLINLTCDMTIQTWKNNKFKQVTFQEYDLFNGAVGILALLLHIENDIESRLIRETISVLKNYLLNLLEMPKNKYNEWKLYLNVNTLPKYGDSRKILPNGGIILGNAHGISGILAALSFLLAKSPDDTVKKYIDLILEKLYPYFDQPNFFPSFFTWDYKNNKPLQNNWNLNSGWCYGSLGIWRTIINTSRVLHDKKLEQFSTKKMYLLLKDWKKNRRYNSLILCHGLANSCYQAYLLFKETNDIKFKSIYLEMFSELLRRTNWNENYLFSDIGAHDLKTVRFEPGLLDGEIGVSSVLLAISSGKLLNTDWLFLLRG